MKETRIRIIFRCSCRLRKRSHISYVTLQRDHLSRLIRHMNQEEANNQSDHTRISEKTSQRSDQTSREKTSQRIDIIKFLDHHRFHVDVKNHFRCVILLIKYCNVKHQIRFADFVNSQRVEKASRTSLSS